MGAKSSLSPSDERTQIWLFRVVPMSGLVYQVLGGVSARGAEVARAGPVVRRHPRASSPPRLDKDTGAPLRVRMMSDGNGRSDPVAGHPSVVVTAALCWLEHAPHPGLVGRRGQPAAGA